MHARRVMDVRVDLPDVVKVPVRRRLLREELLVRVKHSVEVELLLEQHQAVVRKAFDGPQGAVAQHAVHLGEEIGGRSRDLMEDRWKR